jgi:hypothetical protein
MIVIKYAGLCTLVVALMVAPVSGQAPPDQRAARADAQQGQWRLSRITGLSVYDENDQNIGTIEEFMISQNGKIESAILSIGGFLGMGDHLISVSLDKLKFVNRPVEKSATSNAPPPTSPDGGTGPGTRRNIGIDTEPDHPDHAVLSATKDQLKAMPEFKYNN